MEKEEVVGDGADEVDAGGVAEPGHEADDLKNEGPVRKNNEPDGDDQGREDAHEQEIEKAGEEELDEASEFHDVEDDDTKDMVVVERSHSWRGKLPRPDDFIKYPKDVQDKIVEWADRDIAIDENVVSTAARIDEQHSERMNEYTKAELSQTNQALVWTGVLNAILAVGAVICGIVTNNGTVVLALIGGLASVNLIPAINSSQAARRKSPPEDKQIDKK